MAIDERTLLYATRHGSTLRLIEGRRVRVDLEVDDGEGTAVDITDEGHLVLELAEGGRRVVAVGDVVHLRPT